MRESRPRRTIKYIAIGVLVDLYGIFMTLHPLFLRTLWKIWWLRPIIIWYSPFTMLAAFDILCFSMTAIFVRIFSPTSFLTPIFMKFQMFASYIFLKFLHGSELHGLENLPKGGGIVVYYHPPYIPNDLVSLMSYIYCTAGRMIGGSMAVWWHINWFFKPIVELYGYSSDRRNFIEALKNGELRSCAPGSD